MRKSVIVFLILIQILMIFVFQNMYFLFKGLYETDLHNLEQQQNLKENMNRLRKVFFLLSLLTGIFLIATGVYLAYVYKKGRREDGVKKGISPLQNYLLELKDSEIALKDQVEKQHERAARDEELNKTIVNNMDAALLLLNENGQIEIFNAQAQTLFKQSYANAKNNFLNAVLGEFPELLEFISGNRGKLATQDVKSGGLTLETHIIHIPRAGTLVMVREVTALREREEIERKDKNFIMLGEMTAYLAHEVRNSLGVIYGYSKNVQSDLDKNGQDDQVKKVQKVTREIEFLTSMMETFLNFSKPVRVKNREKIDVVRLLRKIGQDTGVEILPSRSDFTVETDPALIGSVFSNLILNAQEAGATRVKVDIEDDARLTMRVRDNGRGIKKADREKIWYPLFTNKEKGTGMGLALVRKILTTLNANIQLVESDSRGTEFKLVFFD